MSGAFPLKLVAWGVALTLVALPILGVLNGWFAAERWPVRYLKVDAEFNHVSAEQIRAATAAHLGTGFFALDLDRVRASVAALPWVERVEVRKRWPALAMACAHAANNSLTCGAPTTTSILLSPMTMTTDA